MRNDERYRQKPMSNQLEIFGLGADGEQDMADARAWIGEHPRAWDFMVEQATRLNRKGYVSINYLIHMVRNELHVGVKNGLAPSLAPHHGGALPAPEARIQQAPLEIGRFCR